MRTHSTAAWRRELRRSSSQVILIWSLITILWSNAQGKDYYVSASTGDDLNIGTIASAPWKTLKRASRSKLVPGDTLLLRAGDQFSGSLQLKAQGAADNPIVVTMFGDGSKPVIDGSGAECCIQLENPAYITIRNLAMTNPRGLYGVRMSAKDAGELRAVVLDGLEIHHVYERAWASHEDPGHGEQKRYGGINAQVLKGSQASWWSNLMIRNCHIHDLGACGISIASEYALHEKLRNRQANGPYPIQGLLVQSNVIHDIARDGVVIRQCSGAIVEKNQIARTGRASIANGLWFWDCEDSVIRYNIGSECRVQAKADGAPFSIDGYCQNCRIEDNYSHDNEGPAFMVFGTDETGTGSVIRGNVSFNDATVEAKPGFGVITAVGKVRDARVEGNVIIAGPNTRSLVGHHDWNGIPSDVTYSGNVLIGNSRAGIDSQVLPVGRFEGNLFFNVPGFSDSSLDSGETARAYIEAVSRIRSLSSAEKTN